MEVHSVEGFAEDAERQVVVDVELDPGAVAVRLDPLDQRRSRPARCRPLEAEQPRLVDLDDGPLALELFAENRDDLFEPVALPDGASGCARESR